MTGDWAQKIKCEYAAGNVRLELPRRELGWARLMGLVLIGFGVMFMWSPAREAWEFIQKLLHGQHDVGNFIFSFFPLLFVVAGCLPLGIGLAILFGRCRVEWRDGGIRSTELVGPFHWTRRLPRKAIRKLEVSAATSRAGNAPPQAMEKVSGLAAMFEDGSRGIIAMGYPKDCMLAVADELKGYIGNASASSEPLAVEVVDPLVKADEAEGATIRQPADSRVQLEERVNGLRLAVPPAGIWKGSKGFFFFSLLWCAFMTVFTTGSFLPDTKWEGSIAVVLLFIVGFWAIGIAMLLGAVNMGRRRAELVADAGGLRIETVGIFGAKQREWRRGEIAAIRADASGMEVNERPVIELQIHPVGGKKAGFLAGRNEEELRWMAAQLRQALQVPARTP